jgi:hypothetical protein
VLGAAAPGPGPQLIRRPRPIRALDRPPCKPTFERTRVTVTHRPCCIAEGAQPASKLGVRWRQFMGSHRARPRGLSITHCVPGLVLGRGGADLKTLFGDLAHGSFLSHHAP